MGFEELGGSKEGAKIVVIGVGYFLADDNGEIGEIKRTRLFVVSKPEPCVTEPIAVNEVGKQNLSPYAGFKGGVLNFVHGDFHNLPFAVWHESLRMIWPRLPLRWYCGARAVWHAPLSRWADEPFLEHYVGCPGPVFRHGRSATVRLVLKNQGDADRAWRRDVPSRQATSEVIGRDKRGAGTVAGESGGLSVGADSSIADTLEDELTQISG